MYIHTCNSSDVTGNLGSLHFAMSPSRGSSKTRARHRHRMILEQSLRSHVALKATHRPNAGWVLRDSETFSWRVGKGSSSADMLEFLRTSGSPRACRLADKI